MKLNIQQIPFEGIEISERVSAAALQLETENVRFTEPLEVKAQLSRITNAIVAKVALSSKIKLICGRCLSEFTVDFDKKLKLEYAVDKGELLIDLDPDIREEIILDYPVKPLCKPECKGLCIKCGKNLNEGPCKCISQ